MPLLEVRNLSHQFKKQLDNQPVLRDVSLTVNPGDFLGILGPNGSGKTTLLRCISGVLKPFQGSIVLEGRELGDLSTMEIARIISVVPQGVETNFDFTVTEFVTLGRLPFLKPFQGETPEDYAVVEWAMEVTGVTALAERGFRELSGGERQRVVVAQALAQQPRLLLLDEPVAHLDISQETEIFNLIHSLNKEHGIAVVVVLHDLNLAARYCESLLLIKGGAVYARGLPSEVLTPATILDVYRTHVSVVENHGNRYFMPITAGEGDDANEGEKKQCGPKPSRPKHWGA